jgi:hypothetical protein
MEFSLLIHGDENAWYGLPQAEQERMYAGHRTFMQSVREAGVKIVYSSELEGAGSARLVKTTVDGPIVTDGPFSETKEQLGGYYVLDVPSIADAVGWAKQIPGLPGDTVEVRPAR